MGACAAELSYGVKITPEAYELLFAKLYRTERRYHRDGKYVNLAEGDPDWNRGWNSRVLKDPNSPVEVEHPYETEERLLVIKESREYSADGSTEVSVIAKYSPAWDETLKSVLRENGLPEQSGCWLLTGHYE